MCCFFPKRNVSSKTHTFFHQREKKMESASFINWHLSGHDQELLRPSLHPAQDTRQHVEATQPNTEGVNTPRMMFNFTVERLTVLSSACWEWTLTTICLLLNLFSPRTTSQVDSEGPRRGQVCRVCSAGQSPPNPFLPQGPHFTQVLHTPVRSTAAKPLAGEHPQLCLSHTLTVLMESLMLLHRAGKNHYCWPSMCRTNFYNLCLP